LLLMAALSLPVGACGKTKPATTETGGSVGTGTGGSASGAGGAGAGAGGGGGASGGGGTGAGIAPCLDRPNDLPQPPGGGLPCDLIPPG
jgi:hypothetical protein